MHGSLRQGAMLALLLTASACGWKPSAPALTDEPVYRDRREGFRFFVPEGWKQRARGEVPSGKISGERMLVEYKCLHCSLPATLMVTVSDVPTTTTLSTYLVKNTLTGEKWRLSAPAEDFTLNGEPAARITYVMPAGKEEMVRDIVAFRRGERVYFFKGFYAASDAKSRRALQTAVDTIVW
jgi:hypothetical protein